MTSNSLFRTFLLSLALLAAAVLGACGGGSGSSSAKLRLLNVSNGYSSLDLSVDDTTVSTGLTLGTLGAYADVDTSDTSMSILSSGVGTAVASLTPSLKESSKYTLIAYGWSGGLKTSLIQEEEEVPDSGKHKLLFMNLAPDAGSLDIYVTLNEDTLDNASAMASSIGGGGTSSYNKINSGTYRIRITGAGDRGDVRLDIPSVTLASAGVSTLIVTATEGGLLVHGQHLIQGGAITPYRATQARVRVVTGVPGVKVGAALDGTSLMGLSTGPTVGDYRLVTAGTGALTVQAGGRTLNSSNPTFKAGGDYTLMVWGDATAPSLTVLTDDNRLPTSSSTAKIRLINAAATTSDLKVNLSLNYSSLASNIQAGSSSSNYTVTYSTSSLLSVTTPSSATAIYTIEELPVNANSVYSVFVLGADSQLIGSLRKER